MYCAVMNLYAVLVSTIASMCESRSDVAVTSSLNCSIAISTNRDIGIATLMT